MGDKSKIEWTEASWTAIRARNKETGKVGWHCEHVTPGCEKCYSETMNVGRFGTGLPFKPGHRKDVDIFLDEKMLQQPLHWKRPRKIFVCSMTDLFADFVPDEWIDQIFAVIAHAPQHSFQILTKRSKRMREYFAARPARRLPSGKAIAAEPGYDGPEAWAQWPLKNVWLGVSCEDQTRADERISDLLATPAAKRFVSAEPLLSNIDFSTIAPGWYFIDALKGFRYHDSPEPPPSDPCQNIKCGKLDWIIVGGESGPDFRPMQIAWAEDIMRQCKAAGTAFFFKQDSAYKSGQRGKASDELWACKEFPA